MMRRVKILRRLSSSSSSSGVYTLGDRIPTIHDSAWIAPTAAVIGDVVLEENTSVWFNVVIRGDNGTIIVKEGSNIQDGSVLHTDPGLELEVGKRVTVGHNCMLHGCVIGDNSLIGIGSVVLNNSKIGKNCIIGANSLIPQGKQIPDNSLVMGSPGKVVKTLSEAQIEMLKFSAEGRVLRTPSARRFSRVSFLVLVLVTVMLTTIMMAMLMIVSAITVIMSTVSKKKKISLQFVGSLKKMAVSGEELNECDREIISLAIGRGCCVRCALNYSSNRSEMAMTKSVGTIQDWLSTFDITSKRGKDNVGDDMKACHCVTCFGLLENDAGMDRAVDSVVHSLRFQKYQLDEFELGISVPVSLYARTVMVRHHLYRDLTKEKKNENASGSSSHLWDALRPTDPKEVLRSLLRRRFESVLGVRSRPCANVKIHAVFSRSESDDSVDKVLAAMSPTSMSKKNRSRKRSRNNIDKNMSSSTAAKDQNRASILKGLEQTNPDTALSVFRQNPTPTGHDAWTRATFDVERGSVYVYGRYNKYLRGLSQTPWFIGKKRMGESSLEEEITKVVVPHFGQGAVCTFQSGGREDIDVRMLGNGRPFLLDIKNAPRIECSHDDCRRLEAEVRRSSAGAVAIRDLKFVRPEDVNATLASMQKAAESKQKHYCALVCTNRSIAQSDLDRLSSMRDLRVVQRTPLRVAHRRTMMDREKIIYSMQCERLNETWFRLDLVASAGTYIKEFIHGDFGRTQPNIGEMLECEADILQLDVLRVVIPTDKGTQ
eukprot:g3677.t1